jgi:phosphoribosylaminoimidazole-succinocarboxamide synthase
MQAISNTAYSFPGQTEFYRGKVRDVYFFDDKLIAIASDRISAFDVVLPRPIPFKGQVLNQIAAKFLNETKDLVPNWLQAVPDPNVSVGLKCKPFPVEIVVRGYLAGHAAREYKAGKRVLCGVPLPEGLKENDRLPNPIITPTTKASEGHDEDISKEEILKRGLVNPEDYAVIERYAFTLFQKGTEIAAKNGLILVDTKYEFGKKDGKIYLIDEVHTPDSSRYFYSEGYEERQKKGEPQRQLSKEFVRQWLIENGFQGKDGQKVPEMTDEIVKMISERYIELYEKATGEKFVKAETSNMEERIKNNVLKHI